MDEKNKPINMIGEVVDVSEHKTYLELVSRVCYYDAPNLNGDMMPYDDDTLNKAQSLVNMPVQGRYRTNEDGEPTFGSHEMVKKRDGSVDFGTQSIGTHTEVYIENDDVVIDGETKNLPCLFAKYRIWKRYKNVVAAVRRLFQLGKLFSSWEITTYKYLYEDGINKLLEYEFLSNCLLGYEYAYPSYGENASAISMAQLNDNQLMIAEALSQDLLDKNEDKEDVALSTEKKTDVVENDVKVSQLTDWDLWKRVQKACEDKIDKWIVIHYMFPNEKEVWVKSEDCKSDLEYLRFTFEVGDNDAVTVGEPENVTLTVSIAEINAKIAGFEEQLNTVNAELDKKNNAIAEASETIQDLNTQIAELTPYKEQIEIAEQKKIEEQIKAEKAELKGKLMKGNLFTETEIAEKEISDLIEARDIAAINSLIADRFVASIESKENEAHKEVEVVESEDTAVEEVAVAGLDNGETETDIRSFMSKILF